MNNNRVNVDELGIFLVWTGIILNIIAFFAKTQFLYYLGLVIVMWAIFRSFSKDTAKRRAENKAFKDNFLNPVKKSFGSFKNEKKDKDHKYITCPVCGQKLRIPKNKGKVKVKCAKCGHKFEARS